MLLFSLLLGMDHVANEINLADPLPARIAFEEALLFMKSKIPLTKEEYYALEAKLRFRAFTVGRLTQMDAIEIVRKKLNEVVSEGRTVAQFFQEAGADSLLQSAGFHDSKPWYWETVYRNNIQTVYNTGRALEIQETQPDLLEFIGIDDGRQTDICKARIGTIRRRDDPWWNGNYPILHHSCFPSGTPIATPQGWKEIQELNIGDLVTGGSGNSCLITTIHTNPFNGNLIRIGLENISTSATPNHRFLTMRGWIKAENLQRGDILVQIPESIFCNHSIREIDKMHSLIRNFSMSLPIKGYSALRKTFNAKTKFRQENINPIMRNIEVMFNFISAIFEMIYKFRFIFTRRDSGKYVTRWISTIKQFSALYRFGYNFRLLESFYISGAKFGRDRLTKSRMFAFLNEFFIYLSQYITSLFFSPIVIDPLNFNCFTSFPGFNLEMLHQDNNCFSCEIPSLHKLAISHKFVNIESSEGFASGAPLDSFNSLESFRAWARSHTVLQEIKDIQKIPYNGIVYNLSVEEDESYCVPISIVHNCRSTVRAIFAEEAKIRGIKQTRLKSYYPPPQPGFGGNPLDSGSFYQLTPGMKERAKQYGILGEIAKAGQRLGIG